MYTYDDARELVAERFRSEYPDDGPERHYVPPWGYLHAGAGYALVPHGCWGEFHDELWEGVTRDDVTAVDLTRRAVIQLPGQQDPTTRELLALTPKVGPWPDEG